MDEKEFKQSFFKMLIQYFRVFHDYSGKRLWLLFWVILFGGLLEGIGLSLLLPILDLEQNAAGQSGYFRFIHAFFGFIGVKVSLVSLLVLLLIVFSCKGLLKYLQEVMVAYIQTDLTKIKRLEFYGKYSAMTYRYYVNKQIGYLNNLITTEVDRAVSGFARYVELITACVYIGIYLVAACLINWRITLLVFVFCAFLFKFLGIVSHVTRQVSRKISEKNAQIQSLLIQSIHYFKYLKGTNTFAAPYKQFSQRVGEQAKYNFRDAALSAIPTSLLEPVAVLGLSLLVIYYVSYRGQPMSNIIVLLLFFYRSFARIFNFQIAWQKFCSRIGGVEVLETTSVELAQNRESTGGLKVGRLKNAITLQDVTFMIGNQRILKEVTMQIPANKAVAIVGESGSGKTTILDMITGLIIPQTGRVSFDGAVYSEIDLNAMRSHIGYVVQEPVIFNDTIANNISFWDMALAPEECQKRIAAAARLAHCVEFIEKTEQGYDSVIGDKGVKLSVGQRQRIAIARELYKNPSIMIFDEATSALDTESEQFIQQSINEIMGTRTMILVAHRLSTIKKCDSIYVLDQGIIVEQGRFDELYSDKKTHFSRMCEAQRL